MYVTKEQITAAREVDLLQYLMQNEPGELVQIGRNLYTTVSHDSLKISPGKWYWWSHGFGGRTALDYLIKVRGMAFPKAVEALAGAATPCVAVHTEKRKPVEKHLQLPRANQDHRRVFAYLSSRGIDGEIINHCLKHQQLYEDADYHNCVFVGYQKDIPRYASLRGTLSGSVFVGEAAGSDKRYGFAIPKAYNGSLCVYVFESAIDAMSYLTLLKLAGKDWHICQTLSLAGVAQSKADGSGKVPAALEEYLNSHKEIRRLVLCLDADAAGQRAANMICQLLPGYEVSVRPPRAGKDYNEFLQLQRGIRQQVKMRGSQER